MADEPQVLRGINWRETFPFTHIFRTFRIAIHPSKLLLALLVVLSLYFGGRILDALWARSSLAIPGEIALYERSASSADFQAARASAQRNANSLYETLQQQTALAKKISVAQVSPSDVRYWIARTERQRMLEDAAKYSQPTAIDQARRRVDQWVSNGLQTVDTVTGQGLFITFFDYQATQIQNVVDAVLDWNWLGGLPGNRTPVDGVFVSTYKFFTAAPAWAAHYHWLYFLLYGSLFLAVWSLFGGAIARIAAVHVADEGRKLSMRQGLGFAVSKFLSFLSAPLIPLIIVAAIGLGLAVIAGIAFLIYLDVLIGAFYFLALAAGFIMTLVLLGTAGGFSLMYPTIAVEGSDSFDAISRSFSYVYSKPWKMLFYSAVAIVYGALTYLFVRFFIWLVLTVTHFCVGLLIFTRLAPGNTDIWSMLQPAPTFRNLPFLINFESLNSYGDITAFFLAAWVYLVIAMLGAFAISFYISASTIIYYLIRRDADATELDDVYLEQPEEDLVEAPVPAPAPAAEEATTSAPAEKAVPVPAESAAAVYPTPESPAAPSDPKESSPSNPPNA
ncbi:MAG TPA: hypothetical protein VHP11_09500 [Tepidisphaeraceae bacterium]|nr:hypothetical protein [Tepidisphaeraceae bacterium]